jgi:hypothetical protein
MQQVLGPAVGRPAVAGCRHQLHTPSCHAAGRRLIGEAYHTVQDCWLLHKCTDTHVAGWTALLAVDKTASNLQQQLIDPCQNLQQQQSHEYANIL